MTDVNNNAVNAQEATQNTQEATPAQAVNVQPNTQVATPAPKKNWKSWLKRGAVALVTVGTGVGIYLFGKHNGEKEVDNWYQDTYDFEKLADRSNDSAAE